MSEDKKEGHEGGCCSPKSSNCCGNKNFLALIVALLIFAGGFWAGKMSNCGDKKICPMSQAQPQVQK